MNITDISLSNKYTTWYIAIIDNAKSRASSREEAKMILGYVESHHIIPKCIIKNAEVAFLSAKEHFICHLLLTKMFSDKCIIQKMNYALSSFLRKNSNQVRLYSARQYELARIAVSDANKSRKISDETRKKIADSKRGSKVSDETRKKLSESRQGEKNSFYGKSHSDETKQQMSESKKGKNVGEDNHFYGKTHSEETKRIISEKAKTRETPDNVKDMLRTVWSGKKRTDDNKKKISESAKGRRWIVNKEGVLAHCNDLQDPRLLTGEFMLGKKWKL